MFQPPAITMTPQQGHALHSPNPQMTHPSQAMQHGPPVTDVYTNPFGEGQQGLTPRFYWDTIRGTKDGVEQDIPVEMIEITYIFDPSTRARRAVTDEDRQSRFPQAYAEWCNGTLRDFSNGTPLAELPGITASQSQHCYVYGINSVEDLVEASGQTLRNIGAYAESLQERARIWLRRRDDNQDDAEIAAEISQQRKMIEDLKRQLEASDSRAQKAEGALDALKGVGVNSQHAALPLTAQGNVVSMPPPGSPPGTVMIDDRGSSEADNAFAEGVGGYDDMDDDFGE